MHDVFAIGGIVLAIAALIGLVRAVERL